MKTKLITLTCLLGLALVSSCSSRNDSTDKAGKINNKKIDNQAVAIGSDAKDKAKEVTESMVELANISLTEYELSKLALRKAVNPEVKAFAQQAMNDHQQDDRDLQALAKQMRVTLPNTLAGKSKKHLAKLKGMRISTEFDTQYLEYMADSNGDALESADDLRDNAPTDAVKSFAKKVLDDDTKHRERARQLKNVLD